jgi:iron complex outermembrane recepter protein
MFPFRSLIFLASASLGTAQSAPVPGPASAPPPPGPAAAQSEPVTLDHFITSATPFGRNQVELAQSTTVLSGRALTLKQQPTVGETLAAETGMSATSFGPGASRPLIRGLGGDRIRLLENSVGTIDASVISPDHAVSIEPFLIERIEVVRGPASLLYGSSAVGGMVNVITHRIETEVPVDRVRGGGEVRFGSGANEFARGALLDLALIQAADHALVLHLDGFRRSADDLRIPGFAESARLRAAETAEAIEHGEPAPDFARGRLPNSALVADGGAAGLSFVSSRLQIGASRSGFNTTYGVPGHAHGHEDEGGEPDAAGVRIALRQRQTDVQAELRRDAGLVSGVRFKLGLGSYRHLEIEPDGEVGTTFTNKGHDARLEVLHGRESPWSGALGLQLKDSDFAATGDEAFLPPSLTRGSAIFAFQEVIREPVTWQFGARLERTNLTPLDGSRRVDRQLSGSLGAVWALDEAHTVALSLAHTGRAPNSQELFAYGPHAGTQSFEIGSPTLRPEKSLGAELSLRRRTGHVTGALTVYANRFHGFIYEQPTGLVALEHDGEWELLQSDDDEVSEHGGGLPVYLYAQRDARFWGAEVEMLWHLHESTRHQIDLRLASDFTRGRADGRNLPRIPAARITTGLFWGAGAWSAGIESQFVLEQDRVAPGETPSAGHTLASAHVNYVITSGRAEWNLFARATNLTNDEARPHPSFVKDLAPLGRRAIAAGVRMSF